MPGDAHSPGFAPDSVLTHNIEAEQALLGALLISNEAYFRVEGRVGAEHFYDPLHAQIYAAIAREAGAGRRADAVSLKAEFEHHDKIGELTVSQYLGRLVSSAVSVISAVDYADVIRDVAVRRMLVGVAQEVLEDASKAYDTTAAALVERSEARLFEIGGHGRRKGFSPVSDALGRAIDIAHQAYSRGGHIAGLSSGLRRLDRELGGLMPSNLVVLAARPAMGKTALALTIAQHLAGHRTPVGFFSLEMSEDELAMRMISAEAGVSVTSIRRGALDANEMARMEASRRKLEDVPLYIDDTGGLTVDQLASRARRLVRTTGAQLIIVDYIQIMRTQARSRYEGTTDISNALKALAKDLAVPVLALSQLNRANEGREDKKPQLSDLRESGAIEQDADIVVFVHRDEYYLARSEPDSEKLSEYTDWSAEMAKVRGKADLIIAKHRHGPTGAVKVGFDGARTRFHDGDDR